MERKYYGTGPFLAGPFHNIYVPKYLQGQLGHSVVRTACVRNRAKSARVGLVRDSVRRPITWSKSPSRRKPCKYYGTKKIWNANPPAFQNIYVP